MHGDGKATVLRSSKFLTSYEESMRTAKHAPKVGLDDKGKGKILDGLQSRDSDGRSQQDPPNWGINGRLRLKGG
jgi:hypothetical protein